MTDCMSWRNLRADIFDRSPGRCVAAQRPVPPQAREGRRNIRPLSLQLVSLPRAASKV
jgi:hypothetical protein